MKIFTLPPRENWICDRFVSEWNENNKETTVNHPKNADIVWLLADWCWNQLPVEYLKEKKVCASVHHITPDKFGHREIQEWVIRDQFVDFYHVPCQKTADQIESLTKKPIYVIPFWTNTKMWYHIDKEEARNKLGIPKEKYLIGSFQRDTEGHDLKSPKLEKGPDLFANTVIEMYSKNKNIHVLLGGWRRQYIIGRLEEAGVPYTYKKLPDNKVLNTMYNSLDLYLVTARYEGGPQAIVECGLSKTPIISTNVGLAAELMHENSFGEIENILNLTPETEYLYEKCMNISIEKEGMSLFREMFKKELK